LAGNEEPDNQSWFLFLLHFLDSRLGRGLAPVSRTYWWNCEIQVRQVLKAKIGHGQG
jgi:hypothetical protein